MILYDISINVYDFEKQKETILPLRLTEYEERQACQFALRAGSTEQ